MATYKIKVIQSCTMLVEADSENDAIDIAVDTVDEYDSDVETEVIGIW